MPVAASSGWGAGADGGQGPAVPASVVGASSVTARSPKRAERPVGGPAVAVAGGRGRLGWSSPRSRAARLADGTVRGVWSPVAVAFGVLWPGRGPPRGRAVAVGVVSGAPAAASGASAVCTSRVLAPRAAWPPASASVGRSSTGAAAASSAVGDQACAPGIRMTPSSSRQMMSGMLVSSAAAASSAVGGLGGRSRASWAARASSQVVSGMLVSSAAAASSTVSGLGGRARVTWVARSSEGGNRGTLGRVSGRRGPMKRFASAIACSRSHSGSWRLVHASRRCLVASLACSRSMRSDCATASAKVAGRLTSSWSSARPPSDMS